MIDTAGEPRVMASTYAPVATVGGQIRRHLRVLLTSWDLAVETVEDALLVVEELVANVVDHARTPFQLTVHLVGGVLRIAVRDRSERSPQVQPFDPHARRGRGLQLVATLSRNWGCDHHDVGKTVWAELPA
jgi:anti-sigma regulatory factor (Ser/Thr protein kinase)